MFPKLFLELNMNIMLYHLPVYIDQITILISGYGLLNQEHVKSTLW